MHYYISCGRSILKLCTMPKKSSHEEKTPAKLIVPEEKAHSLIDEQVKKGGTLLARTISNQNEFDTLSAEIDNWIDFNVSMIERLFSNDSEKESYMSKRHPSVVFSMSYYGEPTPLHEHVAYAKENIKQSLKLLESLKGRLSLFEANAPSALAHPPTANPFTVAGKIFQRFHRVARQLRIRHDNRSTLDIEDEYDVQDLLHALLRIEFDDIRPEEWIPSYAGKSSRTDFLLKNEKMIIEVKKTRTGLTEKELGDQLIIDIERYQAHPECDSLICFVYDPEGKIRNPRGLISDLESRNRPELNLKIVIQPEV